MNKRNSPHILQLQLVVLDNGEPVLTTSPYIFTVEILDVNDHPPEFESVVVNMSVLENQINGTVGTATATDKDKNSVSCYSITGTVLTPSICMWSLTVFIYCRVFPVCFIVYPRTVCRIENYIRQTAKAHPNYK